MTERYIERLLAEEADEAKVWEAIEEYECIDAIRASLGNKEFADYCKGNIIKYLCRYRLKNGVADLKKAQVYLGWMIEAEETINGKT